ncbi:MAG: hypothetical protein ACYC3W_01000 [Candidatus Nanopelagicales bacterium]
MDVIAQIRSAMAAGARTRREIAQIAQLDAGIVDVGVDLLLRAHAIDVHALKFECGAGGCGNCRQAEVCVPAPVGLRLGPTTSTH